MPTVLVVEDEPILRSSVSRGLARLPGVDVVSAGTVEDAVRLIDFSPPDLVLSDLDLPDRSGVELLSELDQRGLSVPVVYVSAYLGEFRGKIPDRRNIDTVEKPVALDELRALVARRLEESRASEAPFSLDEYLQIACLGRHSIVLEVAPGRRRAGGEVVVWQGDVHGASDPEGEGVEAFRRVALTWLEERTRLVCRTLQDRPEARNVPERAWQGLLLDAARALDEERRDDAAGPGASRSVPSRAAPSRAAPSRAAPSRAAPSRAAPASRVRTTAPPDDWTLEEEDAALDAAFSVTADERRDAAPAGPSAFDHLVERGTEAVLRKDYAAAWEALAEADALQPGDSRIQANLTRLRQLGFGDERASEAPGAVVGGGGAGPVPRKDGR